MFPTYNFVLCPRPCYRVHRCRAIFSWAVHSPPSWAYRHKVHSLEQQQRISSIARLEKAKRFYSSQDSQSPNNIVFSDPHRPGLFYHFMNPPTPLSHTRPAFGLSFLHKAPPAVNSAAVIGWLPAQTYGPDDDNNNNNGVVADKATEASLHDFRGNRKFLFYSSPHFQC